MLLVGMLQAQDPAVVDCTHAVQGKVFDAETQEPLAFVSVILEGTQIGVESDAEGKFILSGLCETEYDLLFTFIGYKSVRHHHDYHHPDIEIYLAPSGYSLESVVIEQEAIERGLATLSVTRLGAVELSSLASESFGDIVSEMSGVGVLKTGQNIVKPIVHGLHSNRVLIINNGLRHEFQNWGEDHAPEIDPSHLDQIELVKGAGTVRYGPDALGGVIIVKPRRVEFSSPFYGKVRLAGRTNGRALKGSAELSRGFKRWSILTGGSWHRQGDLRAPNYFLSNTGKEEKSYFGELSIHPMANLTVDMSASHFDQDLGIMSGSVFGNLDDIRQAFVVDTPLFTMPFSYDIDQPRQAVQHTAYKASIKYLGADQALELRYGSQINKRREFGVRRIDAPNIDLELRTQSVDLDWSHPEVLGLSGKIGAQWISKANDNQPGTNTVPFIPNYDEQRLGMYLIESMTVGDVQLEAGLRYDRLRSVITGREPDNTIYRNTILYENISGTVGAKISLSEHSTLKSNIGTAWRAPNVAELYRFGQHAFFLEYGLWRYTINEGSDFVSTSQGILDQSDRVVPSEKGYKWITTYSHKGDDLQWELTGYINYINNYIFSRPAGITRTPRGFFIFFIYDQADALFMGLDLDGKWKHSAHITSEIRGSFLWSKQINPSDFLAAQPTPNLSYTCTYSPAIEWLQEAKLQLRIDYTLQAYQHPRTISIEEFLFAAQEGINRFSDDAQDFDLLPPPPSYLLAHVSWSHTWKRTQLRAEVRNIFDTRYRNYTDRLRYFADDLGRNFLLTCTVRW